MAGDWIKIEHALPDKPEVMEIANALTIDADAVVGKLIRVWTWFDIHTENGNANVTMTALLDRYTGVTGFVAEMQKVGWITESNGVLTINKFERHNGQTAKNRANTNRRVAKLRKCNDDSVTNVTPPPLQKPLPEKRREEKINKETTHTVKENECVIESPFLDSPPEAAKTMQQLMDKINELCPAWKRVPIWNRNEMESLRNGSASQFQSLSDDDWNLLKAFYSAPADKAWFRFDQRNRFCENIASTLTTADKWKKATNYRAPNSKDRLYH